MQDVFAELAAGHGLEDRAGVSADGRPERYLFSPDMQYRYAFGRWWDSPEMATTDVWVLLNPATGDTERRRRPTLERCIARSQGDACSGLVIVNLFAHRHTDPRTLRTAEKPIGPANDAALREFTTAAPRTIVAWGAGGGLRGRSGSVAELLDQPLCLGTTRRGEPRHPLYVRADAALGPWRPPA